MVNLEKYTDFLEAAKESDALSLEGFFGESTRELTLKREFVDQKDFLSACIDDWLSDVDQYGKDEVKKINISVYSIILRSYTKRWAGGNRCSFIFYDRLPRKP